MTMTNQQVHAERRWMQNRVGVYVLDRRDGQLWIGKPVLMVQIDEGIVPDSPTLDLQLDACQSLMDQLWQIGIRPTDAAGSAGAMAEAKEHVKSLQCHIAQQRDIIGKLLAAREVRDE